MRVILISSTPPPMGGIAKWTERMLKTNLPDGWSIVLVNDGIIGNRDPFGDNIGYNFFNEIKRWTNVWFRLLKACFKKETPVVHACPIATRNSMLVNIVSACISRLCGKKHIIHFRCTVPNLIHTKLQRLLLYLLCKISNQIIVLNEQTFNYLSSITSTPIVVIPNFVDSEEQKISRMTNDICRTVLYVGGVTKEKGCDYLIEVARNKPDIEFRLVGRVASEIIDMSKGLKNVNFVGLKDKQGVIEEMQNADVFFFLSRFWGEGFSNAVAEAMAAGLPCVVTNWAANADQIDNGKGGIVVGENVVSDSLKALDFLRDKKIREAFANYNIDKVAAKYSSKIIVKQYINIYNKLCI